MDLFATQVLVFTPRGDVIELPAGSTPLDFAFKIHSAIGCKCVGAKVNGKMVTIDHTLQNGDIVEIVTSSNSSGPSVDWLKIAKSSNARNKIRGWLKKENKSDNIDKGKDLLDKSIRKKGYDPVLCAKSAYINRAMKAMNFASSDEGFAQLASGGSLMSKFCNLLFSYYNEDNKADIKTDEAVMEDIKAAEAKRQKAAEHKKKDSPGVIVKGTDNLMIKLARCCNPCLLYTSVVISQYDNSGAPSQNIDGKNVTKIEKNLDDFFKIETHNNSISIDGDVNYYIIEESLGTIESLRSASLISAKEYNDLIQMGEDTCLLYTSLI